MQNEASTITTNTEKKTHYLIQPNDITFIFRP